MSKTRQFSVTFGALAPPLKEQLVGCGLRADTVSQFQRDADAISRLAVRGLLTDNEKNKARQRLTNKIAERGFSDEAAP